MAWEFDLSVVCERRAQTSRACCSAVIAGQRRQHVLACSNAADVSWLHDFSLGCLEGTFCQCRSSSRKGSWPHRPSPLAVTCKRLSQEQACSVGVQAACAGQDGCRAGFGFGRLGGGAARSGAGKRPSRLIAAPLGGLGPAPPPLDLLCPLQTASQVGRKSSAQAWRAFASWARSWRAQWACPTRRAPPLHTAGQRPRLPPPSGLPRSITRVRQRCLPLANVLSCQSCGSSLLLGLPSTTRCVTRHSQQVPAALPALLCFVELRPREKANET